MSKIKIIQVQVFDTDERAMKKRLREFLRDLRKRARLAPHDRRLLHLARRLRRLLAPQDEGEAEVSVRGDAPRRESLRRTSGDCAADVEF